MMDEGGLADTQQNCERCVTKAPLFPCNPTVTTNTDLTRSFEVFLGTGLGGRKALSNGANAGSGSGVSFDRAECLPYRGDRGSPIGDEAAEFIIGDEAVE